MQPIINEWKLHCEYNKIMYFLLDYYLKTHKINIKNKTDEDNFEETLDTLNITNKYLKDIIKTNIDEISNNENNNELVDNKLLNELLDNNSNNVKIVVRQTTEKELEDLIIKAQNISLKHQAETNRFVISLSNLIFTEKDSNDKFWINSAKNLFIGIVGIFLEDYKSGLIDADKINISSIKKFQNSSLVKINQAYLQQNLNNRKYGSLSKDYLTSILSAAENTYKSITTVFAEKMAIFDDLNVEHITSSNDFDFIDLGIKPIALFIIVPDEEKSYYQLVTLIVGMLTKDLTRFANLPENGGILPRKIECYDISNLSGTNIVAGMCVMQDGVIKKNLSRRFKIKTVFGQDDPKCMKEVIERRLVHSIDNPNGGFGTLPDVIFVDGGITQIRAALEAIEEVKTQYKAKDPEFDASILNIPIFGMVKDDTHSTRALMDKERKELVISNNLFNVITMFQDAVHDTAIGYHKKLREKQTTKSALDEISGIGEVKKKELLRKFGSVKKIRKAEIEELTQIKGINEKLAKTIKKELE